MKKESFDKRHPSVRMQLSMDIKTPVAGLDRAPTDLGAIFVPLCGYQEVQARRLRAAARLCEAIRDKGGALDFPLIVSGSNNEMRRCREMWGELKAKRPWLPELYMEDAYALKTCENTNALGRMLQAKVPQGANIAIVTDSMHMNRVLGRAMAQIDGYTFTPFRASHTWAERRAARAMGIYETLALKQLIDGRMKPADYLRGALSPSGVPQRPRAYDYLAGRAPNVTTAVT